ncbi:MAG: calcium/sodium antiporter [Candidatus Aenigmarchaeota archaeon]|nr:calcium/sodium antiporter [Candidatus Aenigmarchaeota archaeon]
MLEYAFFVIGFAVLLKGADFLVEGASSLAKKLKVSDMVIGLTVVAFGTSMPELVINITASLRGATDIAIGNVLGSNIANILVIFGICAIIMPFKVKNTTIWKETPMHLLGVVVLAVLANDFLINNAAESALSRSDGIIMLLFFCVFMYYVVRNAKDGFKDTNTKERGLVLSIVLVALGLLGLTVGGEWVITNAIIIATNIGISEILISLTIIAFGTSLPEVITAIIAAYKRNTSLAIGTAIGSNIFNIFFVLGTSAAIRPIAFSLALNTDILVLGLSSVIVFAVMLLGKKQKTIERKEGILLLFIYAAYLAFIVSRG